MGINLKEKIKGYLDLTRAHFAPIWPLLFCAGAMLAFRNYGGFSWWRIIHVALIGLFGFEAGMVLNDILDRNVDHIEPDDTMTKYWRPFKERPIPSGRVSLKEAIIIFSIFLITAVVLIAFLPFPNLLFVYGIMVYAYLVESFYNLKKRNQKMPIAQLLGRTDLSVFPIAGYVCYGQFDYTIFLIFAFLYPWALAHLATNDIVDLENDAAKNLKTIGVLYGTNGNLIWILICCLLHFTVLPIFLLFGEMSYIALGGFILSTLIMIGAIVLLYQRKTPQSRLVVLPMFHTTLFVYVAAIILDTAILPNNALMAL